MPLVSTIFLSAFALVVFIGCLRLSTASPLNKFSSSMYVFSSWRILRGGGFVMFLSSSSSLFSFSSLLEVFVALLERAEGVEGEVLGVR